MADTFDPYHKWLGIPPKDQPPNHYRLLGVELFETDSEVIEAAADRQMVHCGTYQIGKHAAQSQQILNEISAAKIVLLTADRKHAYDEELGKSQAPIGKPRVALPVATPIVPTAVAAVRVAPLPIKQSEPNYADPLLEAPLNFTESAGAVPSRARPSSRSASPAWQMPAIGLGVAAVVGVLLLILANSGSNDTAPAPVPLAKAEPTSLSTPSVDRHRTNETLPKPAANDIANDINDISAVPSIPTEEDAEADSPVVEPEPDPSEMPDADSDSPAVVAAETTEPAAIAALGDTLEKPVPADPGLAIERLASKAGATGMPAGAQAFDGPNGDGRHGAKGVLLQAPAEWQKRGTQWSFAYQRDGSPYGLQIIHPFKDGHVLVSLWHDVAIVTSGFWDEFGWGDPASTVPIGKTPALSKLLPVSNTPVQVVSQLDALGNYQLELNGQIVARAKIDKPQPLNLSIRAGRRPREVQGHGNPEFAGAGLPRTLARGEAGLLLGPVDNGVHATTNIRLAPAAKVAAKEKPPASTTGEFQVAAQVGKVSVPNDAAVMLLNCEGGCRLFEIASGRELGQARPNSIATGFLPDGKTPFTAPWEGSFVLWNPLTGDKAGEGIGGFQVKSVAFSADGGLSAVGGMRGVVTISDLASGGQRQFTAFDRDHSVEGLAFSPDSRRVLAVSPDGSAKWMEVVGGNEAGTVEQPLGVLLGMLPDGRIVSTPKGGGNDLEVRDAAAGRIIARWPGHAARINDLAVSRGGDLVTVAADNAARLWNTKSGKSTVLWQSGGELTSVAFSANGNNLVIASRDGRVRYWLNWSARDIHTASVAKPDKVKPRANNTHGNKLTSQQIQEMFGVGPPDWNADEEGLTGKVGDLDAAPRKIGYKLREPTASVTFEFKMKAKWHQLIFIDVDDKLYDYSRGHWNNEASRIVVAGQNGPRLKGIVASPDKWCRLRAELKADRLRFYYDGAPVWSGTIPKTAMGKHSVRVGFDSHETTVSVKDFVLESK